MRRVTFRYSDAWCYRLAARNLSRFKRDMFVRMALAVNGQRAADASLYGAPLDERLCKRAAVDVFQLPAHGQAARDARHRDAACT